MFDQTLIRVCLILGSFITAGYILRRVRHAKVQIEDTIFWLMFSAALLILAIFPGIAYWAANLLGFMSPINFVYVVIIFLLLAKQFFMSIKLSQLDSKVRILTEQVALNEEKAERDKLDRFKAAMDSDRGALGPFMICTDPAMVEAAGHAGYDFVLLDMEHGTTTFQELPNLIRAANVTGVCPVVRVPRGSDIWIDQALDVGAGAVMIPQIDTAEQARAAVSAAKFSPVGTRGTCRFVRSAGFGAVPGSEYFSRAQDTVVILQAEGQKAIDNLDEILDVPGIDVVFVGPYDLSSSLGHVGEIDHPEVIAAIKQIIAKAAAKGVKIGCFADTVEGGKKWRDMGVKFIGYGCDTYIFMQAAKADVAEFDV